MLNELEQSGFIQSANPYGKTSREAIYRLTDEFSLFYLRFLEGVKITSEEMWSLISVMNAYKIWCRMSSEALCLKHISQIKKALCVSGVHSEESPRRYSGTKTESGAQIDLLIDRSDGAINILRNEVFHE